MDRYQSLKLKGTLLLQHYLKAVKMSTFDSSIRNKSVNITLAIQCHWVSSVQRYTAELQISSNRHHPQGPLQPFNRQKSKHNHHSQTTFSNAPSRWKSFQVWLNFLRVTWSWNNGMHCMSFYILMGNQTLLVQVMVWFHTSDHKSDKPLSVTMKTQFTTTYVHHQALVG